MKHYLMISMLMICISLVSAQQSSEDWYTKGVAASTHYQKIAHFTKAIQFDPNFVQAYNARANVYFALGLVQESIQDFSQSIRLDPNRAFTFYSRASCQLALGNYSAAAADFDQVIRLQPNHVYAMSGKGCALLLQGKSEEAVNVLNETLALDETVQSAVRCRAEALKKLGRSSLAISVANKTKHTEESASADLETMTQFILKESTSLRESPIHTSRALLRFEAGNRVELLEKTDEFWWKVRYKNKIGYTKAALLEGLQ